MLDARLIRRVETFLKTYGSVMSVTKLGRIVANDPRLIGDLRAGKLGDKRRAKLSDWLDSREGK